MSSKWASVKSIRRFYFLRGEKRIEENGGLDQRVLLAIMDIGWPGADYLFTKIVTSIIAVSRIYLRSGALCLAAEIIPRSTNFLLTAF